MSRSLAGHRNRSRELEGEVRDQPRLDSGDGQAGLSDLRLIDLFVLDDLVRHGRQFLLAPAVAVIGRDEGPERPADGRPVQRREKIELQVVRRGGSRRAVISCARRDRNTSRIGRRT